MIAALHQLAEQHPGWNWLTILGTAALSWIAPIAGIVTIGCGLLQAYISWQKYKDWKKTKDDK